MTIEDARHWLEIELKLWESECKSKHPIKEALDMAIKALEQEPCEDAISRDAAIDLIADFELSMDEVVRGIHALPSVTPQEPKTECSCEQIKWERDTAIAQLKELGYGLCEKPKTGYWIGHREHCENLGVLPSGLGAYEWCSNCDCAIDVREWHRNHYNYCPNCGAKMVEPQERSEEK